MKDTIKIEINKLLGNIYDYKGEKLLFESFKEISTGKIVIQTHKKALTFLESEISEFINNLKECSDVDFRDKAIVAENTRALSGYTPSAENIEMKATLMEMLAKVKLSPEAIPQAKVACEIVGTMVNIQKTELEMIRMTAKARSRD